ncbi:MAG TPA: glycoside hydrolase family 3 N-terminal domain-containing protein [Candidatus Eremiobacteraceae bacterium]
MEITALADRVGGMLMIGFDGTTIHEAPAELIADLGGAILFQRNLQDAEQTRALVDGLQAARRSGAPPLLIAIDEEGGSVSRLRRFGTPKPSAMALGAAGDPSLTESVYALSGDELASLGINLNLAPVADVNSERLNPVIGIRSFGSQPDAVGRHVAAAIRGLRRSGIASTAKHFPGHGGTTVDSHVDLPVVVCDLEHLRAIELPPFRAAIDAGVDVVMTAHIAFPALDLSGLPATLSRKVVTGLLREELQYDGIICTDCMQMNAVAARSSAAALAVKAAGAGVDLLVYSNSGDAHSARAALRAAVLDETLDAKQVERSLARVEALRSAVPNGARDANALHRIGSPAHRAQSHDAALRGITLVRDPGALVPLRAAAGERILLVHFSGDASAPHGSAHTETALGMALAAGPARIQEQLRGIDPAGHEYKQLLMAAGAAAAVVCVSYRAVTHPLQARAVADLALIGKPVIVVMAREPYDIEVLPPEASIIAAYGDDDCTMSAVADVLLGRAQAAGRLPVSFADAVP